METMERTHVTIQVADRTGDTPHAFALNEAQALKDAKELFERLQHQGLNAYALSPGGSGGGLRMDFNPEVDVVMVANAFPG